MKNTKISINDRMSITKIEPCCKGVLYATLLHKKPDAKYNKHIMIRFNTTKNEMSGCSNGGYINTQEGIEIWDLIVDRLSQLTVA